MHIEDLFKNGMFPSFKRFKNIIFKCNNSEFFNPIMSYTKDLYIKDINKDKDKIKIINWIINNDPIYAVEHFKKELSLNQLLNVYSTFYSFSQKYLKDFKADSLNMSLELFENLIHECFNYENINYHFHLFLYIVSNFLIDTDKEDGFYAVIKSTGIYSKQLYEYNIDLRYANDIRFINAYRSVLLEYDLKIEDNSYNPKNEYDKFILSISTRKNIMCDISNIHHYRNALLERNVSVDSIKEKFMNDDDLRILSKNIYKSVTTDYEFLINILKNDFDKISVFMTNAIDRSQVLNMNFPDNFKFNLDVHSSMFIKLVRRYSEIDKLSQFINFLKMYAINYDDLLNVLKSNINLVYDKSMFNELY